MRVEAKNHDKRIEFNIDDFIRLGSGKYTVIRVSVNYCWVGSTCFRDLFSKLVILTIFNLHSFYTS